MDTQSLAEAVLDPLAIPIDRLYRISPDVYRGMIGHGLLTHRDKVAFVDGLLVHEPAGGAEADLIDRLYRIPLDAYDGIANLGLLGPADKVELLDGLLVKKMTRGQPHVVVTHLIMRALDLAVPDGWFVYKEDPVALPSGPAGHASMPEPDVAVVRGSVRDYLTRRAGPGDVALVVEVAETSLRKDRKALARYAWAGIPVVWIVDLNDRTVEVHSNPTGPAAPASCRETMVYREGGEVPVVLDGREAGRLDVAELLP